jgi:hypothetical protein
MVTLLIFLSVPPALRLLNVLDKSARPYALDGVVMKALMHAPLVVVAVFVDCIGREIINRVVTSPAMPAATWHQSMGVWFLSIIVRCAPVAPFLINFIFGGPPPPPPPKPVAPTTTAADGPGGLPVVIVGGGIGGVVLGLTLAKFRIPFRIIERSGADGADGGADLALWPSASAVLRDLGLTDTQWWTDETYRVRDSYLTYNCGSKSQSNSGAIGADAHAEDVVLNRLSMDNVVGVDSTGFRLVERRKLLDKLRRLLPEGCTKYDCTVNRLASTQGGIEIEGEDASSPTTPKMFAAAGRIAVGCDGTVHVFRQKFTLEDAIAFPCLLA